MRRLVRAAAWASRTVWEPAQRAQSELTQTRRQPQRQCRAVRAYARKDRPPVRHAAARPPDLRGRPKAHTPCTFQASADKIRVRSTHTHTPPPEFKTKHSEVEERVAARRPPQPAPPSRLIEWARTKMHIKPIRLKVGPASAAGKHRRHVTSRCDEPTSSTDSSSKGTRVPRATVDALTNGTAATCGTQGVPWLQGGARSHSELNARPGRDAKP